VTTTLVIGNTAYVASSLPGGAYLYLPNGMKEGSRYTHFDPAHPCDGPVAGALRRCQLNTIELTGHRTGASCGEPMAALAYCSTNIQHDFSNAKIVSINGKTPETYKSVAPCGNPDGELVRLHYAPTDGLLST
jgi:hypothetical protein